MGTHRPPGVPSSMEMSIAKAVSTVCQMRPKAAPRLDNISASVLKENLFLIAPWLGLIYSASLSLHHFLESWNIGEIHIVKGN